MGDYSLSEAFIKRQICPLPVYVLPGLRIQAFRATDNAINMADKEKEERDSFLRSICKYKYCSTSFNYSLK